MAGLDSIYNTSSFDGSIKTDFLKLGSVPFGSRGGLVDYSVADFDEYVEALKVYLRAVYPLDYNNFIESDLGQMILEMFAFLASNLSLKADLLANESFISTVSSRDNLRKLLQLIGISMRGPVSSRATALIDVPDDNVLESGETLTIAQAARSFQVPNTKDGGVLAYTLYKYDTTTGKIELEVEDIVLDFDESVASGGAQFNNVILLEGTLHETEGTFSNTQTVKTIELSVPDITEGSVVVSAEDGTIYNEIQNLFLASGSSDPVFQKVYTDNYAANLVFGDGVRGKSPLGDQSFKVFYREGGGSRGNIPSNYVSISIPVSHSDDGDISVTVSNPTRSSGGQNSETMEHARRWGPYFFKTQYRAVTGEDYTTFTNSFVSTNGGVSKGFASLRKSGAGANMIDIYVLSKANDTHLERASLVFKQELLDYLNDVKMLTDEITIVDGLVRTVDLVVTVIANKAYERMETDIKRKAADLIIEQFKVDNQEFGEKFELLSIPRKLSKEPSIRYAKVDNLNEDVQLMFNEILQLNNLEINIEFV